MNRLFPLALLLFACDGKTGSVLLDKDVGPKPDAAPAADTGLAPPDGSIAPDGSVDPDGSIDPDASIDPDGGIDPDASIDPDGGIESDGGEPTVACNQNPPIFPAFDRSCTTASDCAIGDRQVDCCGTHTVTGVNHNVLGAFQAAAALCASQFPLCGCPTRPTFADDLTTETNGGPAIVECNNNTCETTFPVAVACGPSLMCNSATEVCVAREPIGPSIQYSCDPVPQACGEDRTCTCLAATLCLSPFDFCTDVGPNQINCNCPACQ
jgi:hypothetical protein